MTSKWLNGVNTNTETITSVSASVVPLTVSSAASPSADIVDINLNATKVLSVNSTGNLAIANSQQIDLTGANSSPFLGNASTSFTPTWGDSPGTAPALGNGTQLNKYFKYGRLVTATYQYVYGSTTTFGTTSDAWTWTLPFTAVAALSGGVFCIGSWIGEIGGVNYCGAAWQVSTTTVSLFTTGSSFSISKAAPASWASGSSLSIEICYESTT